MPLDYALVLYYIMTKQTFNLEEIINRAILGWRRNSKGATPFLSTLEKLCLKYLPTLARFPQTNMAAGNYNLAGMNRILTVHQNKKEAQRLKTQAPKEGEGS